MREFLERKKEFGEPSREFSREVEDFPKKFQRKKCVKRMCPAGPGEAQERLEGTPIAPLYEYKSVDKNRMRKSTKNGMMLGLGGLGLGVVGYVSYRKSKEEKKTKEGFMSGLNIGIIVGGVVLILLGLYAISTIFGVGGASDPIERIVAGLSFIFLGGILIAAGTTL